MASLLAHAVVGAALWPAFREHTLPRHAWVTGAVLAAAPDVDVLGFGRGVPYGSLLGHRGLTHSLLFAAALAVGALTFLYPRRAWPVGRGRLWLYLALATASHGVLDALTTGGLGVAFFAPFSRARYFFPWRPILVSPIGVRPFFTARGLAVLRSEVAWIILPAVVFASTLGLLRRAAAPGPRPTRGTRRAR